MQILQQAIERHVARDHAAAESLYAAYLATAPQHAEAWNNFAVLALDRRQPDLALERASRAAAIAPAQPLFQCTRGFALTALGRLDEAQALFAWAVQHYPTSAPAWFGLAEARTRLGDELEAIKDYRRALELLPSYTAAANNLGNLLANDGDLDGAAETFRTLLAARPDEPVILNNYGAVLRDLGRGEEALASFRRALALAPALSKAHSNIILTLLSTPGTTRALLEQEQRDWWHAHGAALPGTASIPHAPDPDRPLRVGFVSADFRQHPVGRHLFPLLRDCDRTAIEPIAYSNVRTPDALTARFRALPLAWRDGAPLPDDALADQIRADRVDILLDLSLHTSDDRLLVFARQPAPVQISFAGYPGETGLATIGWHLTDPVLEPPSPEDATRASIPLRLPHTFGCMEPPPEAPACAPFVPLHDRPVVFGCLHRFSKINDLTLQLWSRILRGVPASRLRLQCPPGTARERITGLFRDAGIATERVEFVAFVPRADYFALYRGIDVVLDTFPYHGHVTAIDALWMGVPVVTLCGELPVSRGGASILTAAGLPELIAHTPDEYVAKAIALAGDEPHLAHLHSTLREKVRTSALMDTPSYTRAFETLLRRAWRNWCTSQPSNRS